MMESTFYPFVRLYCERVISDESHCNPHKPRIQFFIHPHSYHSEHLFLPYPMATRNTEPIETAIAGPAVEIDLSEFLTLNKIMLNHPESIEFQQHRSLMAMLSNLEVDGDAKYLIIDRIIWQAQEAIADMGGIFEVGEEKFNLKAIVKIYLSTFRVVLEDDEDNDDENVDFDSDYDSDGMVPAAKEAIEKLKKVRVDEEKKETRCSICFEDYLGASEVFRLECLHSFHAHCLRAWLERSHYCPLCRFQLPKRDSS